MDIDLLAKIISGYSKYDIDNVLHIHINNFSFLTEELELNKMVLKNFKNQISNLHLKFYDMKTKLDILEIFKYEIISLSTNQQNLSIFFDNAIYDLSINKNTSCFRFLLKYLDINLYINKYENILLNEILSRNIILFNFKIKILINRTKNILKYNIFQNNIIFICISMDHYNIFKYIIKKKKNQIIDFIKTNEMKILRYCILFDRYEFIQYIISLNLDKTISNLLLLYAETKKYTKIKNILRKYKNNVEILRNRNNQTFFTFLLIDHKIDFIDNLLFYLHYKKVDFGSFWCIYNNSGNVSTLHKWITYTNKFNSRALNEKNENGNTPLIECLLNNDLILCRLLVECNLNLLEKNWFDHDALYICILLNKSYICSQILKKIIGINIYEYLLVTYVLNYKDLYYIILKYIKCHESNLFRDINSEQLSVHKDLIFEYAIHLRKKKTIQQISKMFLERKKKYVFEVLQNYILNDDTIKFIISFIQTN